ncbi:hypothetical protein GGR54DRAFT_639137 [Hypoxylon sp. NC1633]|nr:hypothetical protein GGR54DRAFT_639137 [Hypoxylon sp. NC1633]
MDDIEFRVIIVGAGPVGLYMAHAMQRANIDFVVLEQQRSNAKPSGQLLFISGRLISSSPNRATTAEKQGNILVDSTVILITGVSPVASRVGALELAALDH